MIAHHLGFFAFYFIVFAILGIACMIVDKKIGMNARISFGMFIFSVLGLLLIAITKYAPALFSHFPSS